MRPSQKFKQTEIGMIPEDWGLTQLNDISKYINRGISPKYVSNGIPVLNQKCVRDGKIKQVDIKYHDLSKKFPSEKEMLTNDILINSTGVGTLGRSAILREIKEKFIADSHLTIVRIDTNKANAIFIGYYLQNIQSEIENAGEGTSGQQELSRDLVKKIWVPIPELPEQRTIAHILSNLDSKIELNQQMNKTLEAIGQAIFKHWFVDFEFPNEEDKPYRSSGGEMVDSELGKIPKEWKVGSIYEISEIVYGAPFSSKLFNKEKRGLPLIRIRDLKDSDPEFYTIEQHPKGTVIFSGDIIAGMDAEFRPHIWLGEKSYLNQRLCYFKSKNNIHRYFVLNAIKPLLNFFENAKVGTTVIHLGKADIDTWRVIIPTDEVNKKFSIVIDSIFNQIVNNSIENKTLGKIRDAILPKLMSGKIRVPAEVG